MTPNTEAAQRMSVLFRRRTSTPWSEKEIKQYDKLLSTGHFQSVLEDLDVIERYYVYQRRKENGIHRRDLYTFLNNYAGELDRARAWDEEEREKKKRRNRRPMFPGGTEPKATPEDWKRIGEEARMELDRLKTKFTKPEIRNGGATV